MGGTFFIEWVACGGYQTSISVNRGSGRILEGEIGGGKFLIREVGVFENAYVVTIGRISKWIEYVPQWGVHLSPPGGNGSAFKSDLIWIMICLFVDRPKMGITGKRITIYELIISFIMRCRSKADQKLK
jgi:hypothetical protein